MLDASDRAALAHLAPLVGLAVAGLLGGGLVLGLAIRAVLWASGLGGGC